MNRTRLRTSTDSRFTCRQLQNQYGDTFFPEEIGVMYRYQRKRDFLAALSWRH